MKPGTCEFSNELFVLVAVKLRMDIERLKKRKADGDHRIDANYIKLLEEVDESGISEFVIWVLDAEKELLKKLKNERRRQRNRERK